MPIRRRQGYTTTLDVGVRVRVRWETERVVVRYAVLLIAQDRGRPRPVLVFDCSHDDSNDLHHYSRDGVKGPATQFHMGTPSEALPIAIGLISDGYEGMIEQWRA